MHYATTIREGTRLWLTVRDEERIFADMDRMMAAMVARAGGRRPVAVFHADCLARGRYLFNRVMKEELVGRMQFPLSSDGIVPPWLGMYGFGEFARLGGANTYHNYTTAIYAIYRR
jgi:small ligand-binding sensory domain FIST